jgi:hypothetical protein
MKKQFGKFTAEIEPNEDRPGVNCYVSVGDHMSSLACAQDQGYIDDEVIISNRVLDQIEYWALEQGY